MKTAEKLVKKNDKKNETVFIRMADYYPEYKGEQEYCEVSREFYDKFYAEKSSVPETETETITVKTKELYPHLYHRLKEETITLTKEQYDDLMEYRELNDDVVIWLGDYYGRISSEQKYAIVSREVYLTLNREKNKEEYVKARNRKKLTPFSFDEIECGEMAGIYTDSSEKNSELQFMLGELFSSYGQTYIAIATRYFIYGETPLSIAANINKSKYAVWSILRKIKVIVKNAGYSYFY